MAALAMLGFSNTTLPDVRAGTENYLTKVSVVKAELESKKDICMFYLSSIV